jgi:hypothetical protein
VLSTEYGFISLTFTIPSLYEVSFMRPT